MEWAHFQRHFSTSSLASCVYFYHYLTEPFFDEKNCRNNKKSQRQSNASCRSNKYKSIIRFGCTEELGDHRNIDNMKKNKVIFRFNKQK